MSLRNVIYYNDGNKQIPLGLGLNNLPYTDVIVANLQPASGTDRTLKGWGTLSTISSQTTSGGYNAPIRMF